MRDDTADTDRVRMLEELTTDFYEVLQISPNADPDTVHRVYRLLAQRFHPDNQSTGDSEKFRMLTEAYQVLGDPERRAEYGAPSRTAEGAVAADLGSRGQRRAGRAIAPPHHSRTAVRTTLDRAAGTGRFLR